VVGRTGSGKSTTILSLLRILQAHEGTIKIDDIDIYSIDIQKLRVGFSIILQEHFLFSGTVREVLQFLYRTSILYRNLKTQRSYMPLNCVAYGIASSLEMAWIQSSNKEGTTSALARSS
jgi:ABC-type proline/glycine betaine transport system ATPase subunit